MVIIIINNNLEKNKVLGIRISEQTLDEFERYCERYNVSKSEIGRKALVKYLILNFNPTLNPKIIFAKNQFKYCLSCMNSEQVRNLVRISIGNGIIDTNQLESIIQDSEFEDKNYKGFDFQMKTLVRFVFSEEGENWFEEIIFKWNEKKDTAILEGKHSLGPHFSEYIVLLLEKYAEMYNFKILEQQRTLIKNNEGEVYKITLNFVSSLN